MNHELQIDVEPVLLVIAAFFGQKQGPLRAAAIRIDERDFLRECGWSGQSRQGQQCQPDSGSHELTPFACGCVATSSLNTFLALSSKISFLSAALSQSNASIRKR